MITIIQSLVPYLVLASHVLFAILLLSLVFRKSWGIEVADFLGKYAFVFAFLISLAAISGSLFYSDGVGYTPCQLCWWQRIFIYPMVLIFGAALVKRNWSAFTFAVPMATVAAVIAAYHEYVYMGGSSFLPCTALGGACSKIYVLAFGYITIPMMSLTIALYILLLAWARKIHNRENSNA